MEFEGHKMPLLRNYDAILQHQFGDYMKLPPPEDRVARHIVEVNFG
jgi:lipopolysaccharide cholinephosphotransferase